jgi:hypothetical protein
MTVTEQAQELKNNYVTEYNESHRNYINSEEENNMKLSQEELIIKAGEIKREYMKAYRKAHKEQSKKYMETYWLKKAKELN